MPIRVALCKATEQQGSCVRLCSAESVFKMTETLSNRVVQLRSQPCHTRCPYDGCGVPAASSHLSGLVLKTPGGGL